MERALAFVHRGGIWIAGPPTGGRTAEHTVLTDAGQTFGVAAPLSARGLSRPEATSVVGGWIF
ncbi:MULTISPECIES: hypothetical protein [Paenibacillus]|uniref:hypothetical protein n=1 Tax=Paenibacillus TaxID=44249 RepID=UPI002FE3A9D5